MEALETAFRELVAERFGFDPDDQQLSAVAIDSHDLLELVTEVEDKFEVSFDHDELDQVADAYQLLQLLLFHLLLSSCRNLAALLETRSEARNETEKLNSFVTYLLSERELLARNINKSPLPANLLPLLYNLVNHKKEEIREEASAVLQILEGT